MNTYEEVIEFLFSQLPMFQRVGAPAMKYDLSRIKALTDQLGNPERAYPTIHIAGTNGKGTVSHMIAAVLQAAGYKVGLHTSPHYIDFRERIKIDGYLINKEDVIDYINDLQEFIETFAPSFFELSVGLAFKYFQDKKVDFAVIETGLGGRLDSTNIIDPILSIITNIDLDHQEFLGDTLEEIAQEKAGIIKADKPVVLGQIYEDLLPIFTTKADALNAPLYVADEHFLAIEKPAQSLDQSVYQIFKDGEQKYKSLLLDTAGPYQMHNLRTTLQAIDVIAQDFQISDEHIIEGLEEMQELTYYIGRWTWLSRKPLILTDSAHNKASLSYIADWLAFRQRPLHIVLGVVEGKDPKDLFSLFPRQATYYFAQPNVPRGMKAENLRIACHEIGLVGESYTDVMAAVETAKTSMEQNDLMFIGGSSFVVAEVL